VSKINVKAKDYRKDETARLAGGYGVFVAKQDAESLLRRAVMACLLWEDLFYEGGQSVADNIKELVPRVAPGIVAEIAVEARTKQKLRHVPLLIAREMARQENGDYRKAVGSILPEIILRPDELTEFLAIYWDDERQPLSAQVKKGLAKAFHNFNAYGFAKYNRDTQVKLRDVMFLVHPKPQNQEQEVLFKQLAENTLPIPDTWEVALSAGKDKKETWTRLITDHKLGALAFLRNLRNMEKVGVEYEVIKEGFKNVNPRWLLPLNYFAASKFAPDFITEIEELMFRGLSTAPNLPGLTYFVVDVSGSMGASISGRSQFNRLEVALAMAVMAKEVCENVKIYATAGNDHRREHETAQAKPYRGFALADAMMENYQGMGGGGIFTRQCLEWIRENEKRTPDRIIIFSDSQDCDAPHLQTPDPFGKTNYIVDVSAHKRGINYDGLWTAEISGWSEHFLTYIMALEGLNVGQREESAEQS